MQQSPSEGENRREIQWITMQWCITAVIRWQSSGTWATCSHLCVFRSKSTQLPLRWTKLCALAPTRACVHREDAGVICLASLFTDSGLSCPLMCVCVCVCAETMNRALCTERTRSPSSWFECWVNLISVSREAVRASGRMIWRCLKTDSRATVGKGRRRLTWPPLPNSGGN